MPDIVVTEHVIEVLIKPEIPATVSQHVIEGLFNLAIPEVISQHMIEYITNLEIQAVLTQHVIEYVPVPVPEPNKPELILVRRLRQAPIISDEDILVRFDSFEVDLQAGVGTLMDRGVDPAVVMQYSDDSGATWSDEYRLSAGEMGDYVRRVRWTRLGVSRNRVFRIWCTDPVLWVVINAYLELKKGRF